MSSMSPGNEHAGITLGSEQIQKLFPFNIVCSSDLRLLSLGGSLAKLCPDLIPGVVINTRLHMERSAEECSFDCLRDSAGRLVLLRHLSSGLLLRGQWVILDGDTKALFLGSPWITSSEQLAKLGLKVSDFATHDSIVDQLQVLQSLRITIKDTQNLLARYAAQREELRAAHDKLNLQNAALKEQEAQARMLGIVASRTANGVVITDSQGYIIWINDGFTRMTGYTLEEAKGRRPGDMLQGPETNQDDVAEIRRRLRAYEGFEAVLLNYHKSGRRYWVSFEVQPVRDSDGNVTNFMSIEADITERRQMEADLRRAKAEAESLAQAKSEFLANMSHEIRTPMNGVIGINRLLMDTELTDEQRRYVETVNNSAESLLAILNDILDFSKMEAGKFELETMDFSLRKVLHDAVAPLAIKAQEKNLEFICFAAPNVPNRLKGDPLRLRQILTNLVGNAVKFTERGEIFLLAELDNKGKPGTMAERPGADSGKVRIRFAVRDTGIGIPEDKIGQLFNKFSQVDTSTTRRFGGTGLGLVLTKQLADMMGGDTGVESKEGKGSTFWFTAEFEYAPSAESADKGVLAGAKILVVDDNSTNRKVLMEQLSAWEMQAFEAADGQDALKALQRANEEGRGFDLAIVDMDMPGMGGMELARAIRSSVESGRPALLLLTPFGFHERAGLVQEQGFHAWLSKPVIMDDLMRNLAAMRSGTPIRQRSISDMAETLFDACAGKVLLVEDNQVNRMVALGALKKMGLTADVAENGAIALEALERIPYDLVLMDIQMPVMDGFAATSRIRHPQSKVLNHNVTIIAMTAHAMSGDRENCLAAGMNDYITKPLDIEGLALLMRKWLPSRRSDLSGTAKAGHDTSAAPSAAPAVEKSRLAVWNRDDLMSRLMDDKELARSVVALFLEDLPRSISALKDFLHSRSAAEVARQLHTIKGVAANAGCEILQDLVKKMEQSAKAGDLDSVSSRVAELDSAFSDIKSAMHGF